MLRNSVAPATVRDASAVVHVLALVAIVAAGSMAYSNSLEGAFVFDDITSLVENPMIRAESLSLDSLLTAARSSTPGRRPVAYLSFALNYYFGGYEVRGYRLTNVAIHVLNAVLVYWLALLTLRLAGGTRAPRPSQPLIAAAAALLFVVHPVQVQAVTYVVQRMTSLAVLFYLLALVLYVQGRLSSSPRRRIGLWALGLLTWLLALGTKQITVTLPIVVALYEWYFFQHLSLAWLRRNLKLVAMAMLVVAGVAVYYVVAADFSKAFEAVYEFRDFTLKERVLTQFRVVVQYLSLIAYPHPSRLTLDHFVETSTSLLDPPTTVLSMLLLAGLLAWAVWVAGRDRLVSFCVVWFFIHLAIESTIWPLEMMFEHRIYLPLFGVVLLVSYVVVGGLWPRWQPSVAMMLAAIVALGLGTYARNPDWRDEIALWSDAIRKNPTSARAHNNVAVALKNRDRYAEAIEHYRKALALNPEYSRAWLNLGVALGLTGKDDAAIDALEEALRHDPLPADAKRAHRLLGKALLLSGRAAESVEHLETTVAASPGAVEERFLLGQAWEQIGEPERALSAYRQLLDHAPDHTEALEALSQLLVRLDRPDEALAALETAVGAQPSADAHFMLGTLHAELGELDAARTELSAALRFDPSHAPAHNWLGVVHAMQGEVRKGLEHFERALEIDPGYQDAERNRARASSYLEQNE